MNSNRKKCNFSKVRYRNPSLPSYADYQQEPNQIYDQNMSVKFFLKPYIEPSF